MGPVARRLAVGFLGAAHVRVAPPQAGRRLAAVGKGWSLTASGPLHLDHFRQVSVETPRFIVNSLLYSGLAVLICLAIGCRWRGSWRGPDAGAGRDGRAHHADPRDPGTAIGIAYIRAFHFRCRGSTWRSPACGSSFRWCFRRAPAAVHRAQHLFVAPARAQVDGRSGRERGRRQAGDIQGHHCAARVEGHPGRARFFSFIMSIQEASATLFLTLGGWE